MPFSTAVVDRERDKFVENPTGETSVRVLVSNESGQDIPVTGAFNISAPTGPFKVTVFTANDTADDPLPVPLTNRVSLSIRNKSATVTAYFGNAPTVTADDTATGGWEIGPGEDFNVDLNDSNAFYLITPSGQTALVKILEIASTASSGGSALTFTQETLTGIVNNANTIFTTSQIPASGGMFTLYINGLYQTPITDYNIVANTITLTVAPNFGTIISAAYEY